MKPFYPIFNLSYPIWKEEIIQEFVREDDELLFNEYILNQTFVDCRGNLFKVIDSINIEVTKVFFFKSKRKIMILENTNNKISFQELKDELLKK